METCLSLLQFRTALSEFSVKSGLAAAGPVFKMKGLGCIGFHRETLYRHSVFSVIGRLIYPVVKQAKGSLKSGVERRHLLLFP